jgi:hypothetical protein
MRIQLQDLGVQLGSNMNFHAQVDYIVSQSIKTLG